MQENCDILGLYLLRSGSKIKRQSKNQDRRLDIIKIAFSQIASKGLEGLRVRSVAKDANINHATLLHYFPSKEDLIRAVVEYVLKEFQGNDSSTPTDISMSPIELIQTEFVDISQKLKTNQDLFVVLMELTMRRFRDETISKYMYYLDRAWASHLSKIINLGIKDKSFRSDLDVDSIVLTLMNQIKGLSIQGLQMNPDELDNLVTHIINEVKDWLCK